MAEIAPVTVGRAIPAQTARNQRPQGERARPELDEARQTQVARQAKFTEDLAKASQSRTQTVTDEQRTLLADQNLFDAQRESQDIQFSDQQLAFLQAESTDELAFDLLERDRSVRLTDRREGDRDFLVQQQIDQQIAEARIAEIPFDPDLPRGSLVDISV